MNEHIPPLPKTLDRTATWLQLVRLFLRSGLAIFLRGSYGFIGVSRHKVPHIPRSGQPNLFMVREPRLVREMLVERATDFPKSQLMRSMLLLLTGDSIFVSNGKIWQRQRRIIDQAFENARVRDVFELMNSACADVLVRFSNKIGGQTNGIVVLDMDIEMTHFAGDIIFRTIFSEPMTALDAQQIFSAFDIFQRISFAHGYLALIGLPTRMFPSYWRAKRAAKAIRAVLRSLLDRRLSALSRGQETSQSDILATLIKASDPVTQTRFDEDELLDQIAMLFLAGHETSAASLGWALYLIANRPDVQERMRSEASAAFGDRIPQFSDLRKMPFIRDVFRETLRLYPPVAFFARDAAKAENFGGQTIASGEPMIVPTWLMHRHSAYWEDPNQFNPDRFSNDATREAQRNAYLPFSMGPRVCVGAAFALQEAVLILSQLIRRFEFMPVDGHTPDPVSRLTVRSDNGIPMKVKLRTPDHADVTDGL